MTDLSKGILVADDGSASDIQKAVRAITKAEDRVGIPEDVADVALLLVSEKSRWLTAQWIPVSGGITGIM